MTTQPSLIPRPVFEVRFVVQGPPRAQGSGRALLIGGKPRIIHASDSKLQTYRRLAKNAAVDAMRGRLPVDVPVSVDAVFKLQRPKRTKYGEHPAGTPDLDKLQRALGDALTGTVITDDARIVSWRAIKAWADLPSTEVRVTALEG